MPSEFFFSLPVCLFPCLSSLEIEKVARPDDDA